MSSAVRNRALRYLELQYQLVAYGRYRLLEEYMTQLTKRALNSTWRMEMHLRETDILDTSRKKEESNNRNITS